MPRLCSICFEAARTHQRQYTMTNNNDQFFIAAATGSQSTLSDFAGHVKSEKALLLIGGIVFTHQKLGNILGASTTNTITFQAKHANTTSMNAALNLSGIVAKPMLQKIQKEKREKLIQER